MKIQKRFCILEYYYNGKVTGDTVNVHIQLVHNTVVPKQVPPLKAACTVSSLISAPGALN